jgi:hypothetical protein
MIRADTGSLRLYEKPVFQPASLCFCPSFSYKNIAQTRRVTSMGYKSGVEGMAISSEVVNKQ